MLLMASDDSVERREKSEAGVAYPEGAVHVVLAHPAFLIGGILSRYVPQPRDPPFLRPCRAATARNTVTKNFGYSSISNKICSSMSRCCNTIENCLAGAVNIANW